MIKVVIQTGKRLFVCKTRDINEDIHGLRVKHEDIHGLCVKHKYIHGLL